MSNICTATRVIDDARIRITRFDFSPGRQTGWHIHETDCVITALTDGHMRLELPDDTAQEVTIPAATVYRRDVGVEHTVINAGAAPKPFVELELK